MMEAELTGPSGVFKKALGGRVAGAEIDGLIENVPGAGIRLTVAAQQVRVRVGTAA